jgi:hypothetical protein
MRFFTSNSLKFSNENSNTFLLELAETCNLFDGFGIIVQFLMGWIILGILICKKNIKY